MRPSNGRVLSTSCLLCLALAKESFASIIWIQFGTRMIPQGYLCVPMIPISVCPLAVSLCLINRAGIHDINIAMNCLQDAVYHQAILDVQILQQSRNDRPLCLQLLCRHAQDARHASSILLARILHACSLKVMPTPTVLRDA